MLTYLCNKALWKLYQAEVKIEVKIGARFMLNNVGMTRQLALLGQGIIFTPLEVVQDDINKGLLTSILSEWQGDILPVYALTETRLLPAKVRVFIDFLKEKLNRNFT